MLETLRTESVRIRLELCRRSDELDEERLILQHESGTYHPAPYQFVYLRVRIANCSCE